MKAPFVSNSTTSEAASKAIDGKRGRLKRCLLAALKSLGETGATGQELEDLLSLSGDTIRPLRILLRDEGLIVESRRTRLTRARRRAFVWVAVAPPPPIPRQTTRRPRQSSPRALLRAPIDLSCSPGLKGLLSPEAKRTSNNIRACCCWVCSPNWDCSLWGDLEVVPGHVIFTVPGRISLVVSFSRE